MRRIAAATGALLSLLAAGAVAAQSPPCPVRSLTVDPSNGSILYATSSGGGLFGSSDGGSTWRLLHSGVSEVLLAFAGVSEALALDPSDSEHLLLSTGRSLIESRDGGQNWTELAVPSAPDSVLSGLFGVAFDPLDRGTLYVVGFYQPPLPTFFRTQYLYKSVDGGQSWSAVLTAVLGMTAPILDRSSAGRLVVGIWGSARGPTDPSGTSLQGILISGDGGLTWSASLAASLSGPWCRGLVADPADPKTLYAEVACDTYESSDGGNNWMVFPLRNDCSVQTLISGPSEVFANGLRGILRSHTGSLSWEPFLPVGNTLLAVDPSNGDVLYVAMGSALLKSVDGGRTFNALCEAPARPEVQRSGPRSTARSVAGRS